MVKVKSNFPIKLASDFARLPPNCGKGLRVPLFDLIKFGQQNGRGEFLRLGLRNFTYACCYNRFEIYCNRFLCREVRQLTQVRIPSEKENRPFGLRIFFQHF